MKINYKLPTLKFHSFIISTLNFQFLFFQAKRVNHCESYVDFQDVEHNFKETSFITFIILGFHEIFSKFGNIVNPFKAIYRQLL